MNKDELKKKIMEVLNKNFTEEVECTPVYTTDDGKEIELPEELCEMFNDIVTQAVIPYFADALIAAGIGDVKEAERRAEVAEKAGRIIQRDMARVFDISNPRVCELIANIWDLAKKQAEKELAEEGER